MVFEYPLPLVQHRMLHRRGCPCPPRQTSCSPFRVLETWSRIGLFDTKCCCRLTSGERQSGHSYRHRRSRSGRAEGRHASILRETHANRTEEQRGISCASLGKGMRVYPGNISIMNQEHTPESFGQAVHQARVRASNQARRTHSLFPVMYLAVFVTHNGPRKDSPSKNVLKLQYFSWRYSQPALTEIKLAMYYHGFSAGQELQAGFLFGVGFHDFLAHSRVLFNDVFNTTMLWSISRVHLSDGVSRPRGTAVVDTLHPLLCFFGGLNTTRPRRARTIVLIILVLHSDIAQDRRHFAWKLLPVPTSLPACGARRSPTGL